MDKEIKNGLIDMAVSFLLTVMVIFLIVGGVSISRLLSCDTTTFLGWLVGLAGLIIYLAGFLIVWCFIFDSINGRIKNED